MSVTRSLEITAYTGTSTSQPLEMTYALTEVCASSGMLSTDQNSMSRAKPSVSE